MIDKREDDKWHKWILEILKLLREESEDVKSKEIHGCKEKLIARGSFPTCYSSVEATSRIKISCMFPCSSLQRNCSARWSQPQWHIKRTGVADASCLVRWSPKAKGWFSLSKLTQAAISAFYKHTKNVILLVTVPCCLVHIFFLCSIARSLHHKQRSFWICTYTRRRQTHQYKITRYCFDECKGMRRWLRPCWRLVPD